MKQHQIDQILATNTACESLPVIDPFEGVLTTVYPPGFNRRPWLEIQLSVYFQPDRVANGEERANAIADQASAVVGYDATVWMDVGGTYFQVRAKPQALGSRD